jgi:riboflavin biosynthesis pyrimidine reductase
VCGCLPRIRPRLLSDLFELGLVDERRLTQVPTVVGGQHRRILFGPSVHHAFELRVLIEAESTLLGRRITQSGKPD